MTNCIYDIVLYDIITSSWVAEKVDVEFTYASMDRNMTSEISLCTYSSLFAKAELKFRTKNDKVKRGRSTKYIIRIYELTKDLFDWWKSKNMHINISFRQCFPCLVVFRIRTPIACSSVWDHQTSADTPGFSGSPRWFQDSINYAIMSVYSVRHWHEF